MLTTVPVWRAFDCGFTFADCALADFIFADTTFADYAFADSTFADLRLQITHLRIFKYGFAFADYQRIFRLKNFPSKSLPIVNLPAKKRVRKVWVEPKMQKMCYSVDNECVFAQ